jgi:outer membrane protein assembly factor BamB
VWSFSDPAEYPSIDGLAVWNGRVYSPGTDHLFVLDARSGHLILKIHLDGARGYEPVVEDGVVYVTARYRHPANPNLAGNGFVAALDALTGATLWRVPIDADDPAAGGAVGPVALTEDLVLVGTNNEAMLGIDRATGIVRWSYQSPKNLPYGSNIEGGVAVVDTVVVAGATSGRVTGVSIRDGRELWIREHGGSMNTDVVPGPGVVIIALGAVQGITADGKLAWFHGFYPTWRHLSSPTYRDGVVYTGGPDGIAAVRLPRAQ